MSNALSKYELTPQQMLNNLDAFINPIHRLAEDIGLDLSKYQADHIALRINDTDLAKQAHAQWKEYGEVISSAQINGRPIIVIKFDQKIVMGHWQIECLELPYPAAGKSYPKQGWEHVEFVIPSSKDTVDGFVADVKHVFPKLDQQWNSLTNKNIDIKLSSPKGEGERLSNPTIAFKREGVCIKLHPHALSDVVASEKALS